MPAESGPPGEKRGEAGLAEGAEPVLGVAVGVNLLGTANWIAKHEPIIGREDALIAVEAELCREALKGGALGGGGAIEDFLPGGGEDPGVGHIHITAEENQRGADWGIDRIVVNEGVAPGLVQADAAIAVEIGAVHLVAELVPAGKGTKEIGGEILVEGGIGLRAAAGGFAVAFRGEKAGNEVITEREIWVGLFEKDIAKTAAETLGHYQDHGDMRGERIDIANERCGVEILVAPEIVEGSLVLVIRVARIIRQGAVAGEIEQDGRAGLATEGGEAMESVIDGSEAGGAIERRAENGGAREDFCAKIVIGQQDIERLLGQGEVGGVGIGEVAAGGFAIGKEDDAARGGGNEAGDEAEMLLDLGGVVGLVRAPADEKSVNGRGGCDGAGPEEKGESDQAERPNEGGAGAGIDCACHGAAVLRIMPGMNEERKRPSNSEH